MNSVTIDLRTGSVAIDSQCQALIDAAVMCPQQQQQETTDAPSQLCLSVSVSCDCAYHHYIDDHVADIIIIISSAYIENQPDVRDNSC